MSKVTIKNLRFSKPEHEWQVKVDRSSVLGNPFYMANESQRDKVCDKYETYFNWIMQMKSSAFYKEVGRLLSLLKKYGKLDLYPAHQFSMQYFAVYGLFSRYNLGMVYGEY